MDDDADNVILRLETIPSGTKTINLGPDAQTQNNHGPTVP